MRFFLPLICIVIFTNLPAQEVDSLRKFVNTTNNQEQKLDALIQLFDQEKYNDSKVAEIYANKALKTAQSLGDVFEQGNINNKLGLFYAGSSEYQKALMHYNKAIEYFNQIDEQEMIGVVQNNIGLNYGYQRQYGKELEILLKALTIFNELELPNRQAMSYINIGNVYIHKEDYDKSLSYYEKARTIYEENKDYNRLGTCMNNMASIYFKKGDYEKSYESFRTALKVYELLENQRGITMTLYNSASPLMKLKRYEDAELTLMRALKLLEESNDQSGLAICYNNLGALYFELDKLQESEAYFQKSLNISKKLKFTDLQHENHKGIAEVYEKLGRFDQAYVYYKKYAEVNDSINTKQIEKINEVERKLIADKNQQEIELLNKESEIKAYQTKVTVIVSVAIIVLLVLGLYSFYKKYQNKNKINKTLEEKNKLIADKNQEITDSINYAKRIQSAILPPEKMIKDLLPDSFVTYIPKDIVAGDFYWLVQHNDSTLFAVADCTGHGVPGAMVSVVCNSALYQSVREYNLTDPGLILDKTREIVVREFEKSEETVKDGMDIALCSLKTQTTNNRQQATLEYAGAHNPLWIIRNKESVASEQELERYLVLTTDNYLLYEIKADKQPIGEFEHRQPFKTHSIPLQKNDTVYIFSDGFVDQFGGPKAKKLKASGFKQMLLEIQELSMKEQQAFLENAFSQWKGSLEQLDDVCVMGIKI